MIFHELGQWTQSWFWRCGQVVEGFGSIYPSKLSVEQCPCGAEVEPALCEACHVWKDRTFAWASPSVVGSSHLCWTSKEAAAEMGGGFSKQIEFKLLNSTLWGTMTPCPPNSFLCISVLVLKWCFIFLSCVWSNPWGDFLGRLCWACGTGQKTWIVSLAFCLNPKCL